MSAYWILLWGGGRGFPRAAAASPAAQRFPPATFPLRICSAALSPVLTVTCLAGLAGAGCWPQGHPRQEQVGSMDGKRGAQPAGSGDEVAAQGGASPERQTRRLSLDGAAGSVGARSRGQEPSEDTLQRLLPLLLERVEPEGAALLLDVCKEWRREMEARGFCSKTVQLCSALAGGGDFQSLGQIALRRLHASTGDAERTFYIEARAFLQRSCGGEGGLREWLQAASQEPDASFLSKGAASTAESLGLLLVQWAGKPQGGSPAEGCPLAGHGDDVTSVAVSPDGKRFASGSNDTLVKIWAADSGAEGRTLAGHTTEVSMVAFSSDGTRVFSGTREGVVKIWDTETGAEVLTLMGSQTTGVFKTNGTHVVCGSDSGLVRIWSAETGAQVCTVTTHGGEVTSVDISPDGKRVVSATEDGLVTIWDTETGAGVLTPGHKDFVISVAFSPDGKLVISGSFDGVVKIWDAATGAEVLSLGEHNGQGLCLCAVDEEGHLEMDDDDENIIHPECPVIGHRKDVTRVEFTHDGAQAVSGSRDDSVRVWDVASGTQVRQLAGEKFACVEGPSEGHKTHRHVLTARGDTLLMYKIAKEQQHAGDGVGGAPVACFKAPQCIKSVRCHGAAICVGCDGGAVCILQALFLGV